VERYHHGPPFATEPDSLDAVSANDDNRASGEVSGTVSLKIEAACRCVLIGVRRRNRNRWKKAPKARDKSEKCITKHCRNKKAAKKTVYKSPKGHTIVYEGFLNHCWKCRSRRSKEKNPATYVLNMLRHSAKKRKLPFTITKAEFAEFCAKTGYLEKRGNKEDSLTLDRIDRDEGYHITNLRVLTHAENSAQGADNTPREERGCASTDDYVEPPVEPPNEDPF